METANVHNFKKKKDHSLSVLFVGPQNIKSERKMYSAKLIINKFKVAKTVVMLCV